MDASTIDPSERLRDVDIWNNIIRSSGQFWIAVDRTKIEGFESGYNLFWAPGATDSTAKFHMQGGGCTQNLSAMIGGLSWWQTCADGSSVWVSDEIGPLARKASPDATSKPIVASPVNQSGRTSGRVELPRRVGGPMA